MKANLLKILLFLVLPFLFFGCTRNEVVLDTSVSKNNNPNSNLNSNYNIGKRLVTPEEIDAVEYGNGIYYFPLTGAAFGNMLSKFKVEHPNLEEVTITGEVVPMVLGKEIIRHEDGRYGYSTYGATVGYWVTFREKK